MTSEGRFSPVMESDSESEFLVVAKRTAASSVLPVETTTTELGLESYNHRIMVSHPSLVYPKMPTPMSAEDSPVVAETDGEVGRSMDDADTNKENGKSEIYPSHTAKGGEEGPHYFSIRNLMSCACWASILLLVPVLKWLEGGGKAGAPQCVYIRMRGIPVGEIE